MEVILLGAMMVKYDTIVSTFWNLDPFLNIERNSGYFCYNIIIILKSLYVLYAMQNAIPKLWMLIFTFFGKYYLIYMRPDLVLSACLTVACHCFDICVAQMTLMGILAITCESYEFILDINVLFCTLYYAGQTYKREIHKLVIIICLSLSIGSYVNNIESTETFKFGVYYLLVVLCLSTVLPLLPNRKKYGHRLKFYMTLLIVWIVYKGGLHCTNERLSALQYGSNNVCNITQKIYESNNVCNITQNIYESQTCGLNETLETLSLDDILNYGNLRKVDLKVKNLQGVMDDEKVSRANKKEASCKYDLIPDKICSMKVDNTEENSGTEMKGRTDGTNPEIGRIEATEYDTQSNTDMKVDNAEQEITETDIKERIDETANSEVERIEAAEYDKASMTVMKEDNTEHENSETEIKERTDRTIRQEIGRIEATEYDKPSMADDRKVDSTKQENSETDVKESVGTINTEIGHIESAEYHKASVMDMKVDSPEQENLEIERKEWTDGKASSEMEHIEAAEHHQPSDRQVASTEQESLETEIKERTDGPTNKEMELIEATENDKVPMTELIDKLILTFRDEKNALEEDNTNLRQTMLTEDIHHWTNYPFEEDIVAVNLFQIPETHGYAEYMDDQSDTTENFPVTETSVDDIDYTIEKRLGNVERIDNGIILHHETAYKALEFKTSPKSKQQSHKKDEFVAMIQNLDDDESEGTLTRTKTEIKETKVQATETYVLSEKDSITQAVPVEAFMDETTEVKPSETRVLEHAESGVFGESRFHSTHVSKNEENYLQSENGNTTANECKPTAVVKPQNSLLKDSETRNLEAQETELVSNNIMEEIDAKRAKALLSQALSNPNQVDEIQNKWSVSKERGENKADSSEAAQATEFGSIEYLKTKETCKSQIQEHFMETKVREMTVTECSEPIVSTTKDCEKKFALARYSRASDYEICKPIPSASNHETPKDSSSSATKFEPFRTEKAKTINLQTTENTDKTTELKYLEENSDSIDEVVASNASYFPKEVGDNELRNSLVNENLANETIENESVVLVDSKTTTLQTTMSYQTSERAKRDPGENDQPSYSNEASAIKFKPVHRYESKIIEAVKFKDTETKETKERGSGPTKISDINAEEIKFTSASSPGKNKIESAKKDEAESIATDTIKSQADEIGSVESDEGKVSTSEPVLPGNHENEASGIRACAFRETETSYSGTTKIKARNIYSYTIEPKSKQKEYHSDTIELEDDSRVGTKELEPTETSYLKERKMEIIKVASPKENRLKFTKSREIGNSFTEATELKITKSNRASTVQPKSIQEQQTSDSISNEHGYKDSHLTAPISEETKASYSNTRETTTIKVMGPEKNQLPTKSSEIRDNKDTYTGGTKLRDTRSDELLTKPSQDNYIESDLQFNEVGDPSENEVSNASRFDAKDIKPIKLAGITENRLKHTKTRHPGDSFTGETRLRATKNVLRTTEPKQNKEQEVSHRKIEEIEISNESYPSAREIQPIKVTVSEKSSLKSTKAKETKDAYKGDTELGDKKTDASRTFERKPTKQGDVSDSIANEPNKVSRLQKNVLEATTVSYFVATEIEPIKVAGPKESQSKSTKSGDVEISKSESTIDSEDIQTKSNKAEELEGNKFEMAESSKDNYVGLGEELPILTETSESDYPNKASHSEEIGKKATVIDNFNASEYISITSGYIGSRKVSDVSEIKVTEFKESKDDVGELGKQVKKVKSSKPESEVNTFQSNGPAVASIPRELKLRKVTNHKVNEFDLSETSNFRANENKLMDGNGKLIEPKIEFKYIDEDNEKNKADKREFFDTNGSEESQAERETEVIDDRNSEIGEIGYQDIENAKRAIEHPLTASEKSEISGSYTKTELLLFKSNGASVIRSDPKETEDAKFAKAETVIVAVERSEKILSKGNVPPHRLDSADIIMTKIHGIKALGATEIIPEVPDTYKNAATFQVDKAGETIETKSEVQKSQMNYAEAAGPEVFQSAEKEDIAISGIKNDFA